MIKRLLVGSLLAGTLATAAGCQAPMHTPEPTPASRADNVQLMFTYRSPAELGKATELGFDLFGVEADKGLAYGQVRQEVLPRLQAAGIRVKVVPPAEVGVSNTFDKGYRTYEQLTADVKRIADTHGEIVTLKSIGKSWETTQGKANREIWALRITGPGDASKRPAVAFTANIHARELATSEVAMRLTELLTDGYAKDPKIKQLVDTRVIHIVPMLNPDGHFQAEKGENWRKNTHPFKGGVGVDLNRNFPFKWDLAGNGAETDPSSDIYKGPSPASEPETQAIKAYLASIPNFKIGMDYHSYSNLIMWSWGWTSQPPKDAALLTTIGKKLASFNGYKPMQASGLYPTSGTIRDFVYGELGVPYYTTEMGSRMDGFDPSFKRALQLWEENKPGALYLIEIADNPSKVLAGRR